MKKISAILCPLLISFPMLVSAFTADQFKKSYKGTDELGLEGCSVQVIQQDSNMRFVVKDRVGHAISSPWVLSTAVDSCLHNGNCAYSYVLPVGPKHPLYDSGKGVNAYSVELKSQVKNGEICLQVFTSGGTKLITDEGDWYADLVCHINLTHPKRLCSSL